MELKNHKASLRNKRNDIVKITEDKRPRKLITWKRVFLALLLLNMIVVGRDVCPGIYTRFARMGMGSALSNKEYSGLVVGVASRWMEKLPRTASDDEHRLLVIDDIKRLRYDQFARPQATLALGICDLHSVNKDPRLLGLVAGHVKGFVNADGSLTYLKFKCVEDVSFGRVFLYMYKKTGDKKYLNAARKMADYLKEQAALNNGTVPYNQGSALYFVDALPIICPFLVEYGISQKDPAALQLAIRQMMDFIKYGTDQRTGMPIQVYNAECYNMPVGGAGWGRGVGWYARGLVYTVMQLPDSTPEKKYLQERVRLLSELALKCELPDGGWGSKLGVQNKYDSSATALIADALEEAVEAGMVKSATCQPLINRALLSLKKHTRRDGTVDFAEGVCMGAGKYSSLSLPAPYAQGAVLSFVSHLQENDSKTDKNGL